MAPNDARAERANHTWQRTISAALERLRRLIRWHYWGQQVAKAKAGRDLFGASLSIEHNRGMFLITFVAVFKVLICSNDRARKMIQPVLQIIDKDPLSVEL